MFILWLSCQAEPEVIELDALKVIDALEVEKSKAPVSTEADSPKVEPLSEPVYPNIQFVTLSDLHQNFFSEPTIIDSLAQELGGHVNEGVDMEVAFEHNAGQIKIFQNKPLQKLEDLRPVGVALGQYRHDVAARFDLRVLSFEIWLIVGKCRFSTLPDAKLSGGFLSPCYYFGKETQAQCGEYTTEGIQWSAAQEKQILECLITP
jgi:hypothetical protein